ncbi:MAG: hypothetical protein JXA19_00665 [Anaerolineales bacterium]|nr:hypothetical protein [Anaerolineales bacterium]
MNTIAISDVLILMAAIIFVLGLITFLIGIFILVTKAAGKNIDSIAEQTEALAQKGITDGISGLVGNVSLLMSEANTLVRTTAGIGIFLTFVGFILMAACVALLFVYSQYSINF